MTREEARKAAEVMLAFANEEEIEYRIRCGSSQWFKCIAGNFDWMTNEYRIKPTPKNRPFINAEEYWNEMQKHQPFGWVKDKYSYHIITSCHLSGVWFADREIPLTFGEIFEQFTFADGDPVGIKD